MGRRSINTTKSGKYMNPTDQARKEARKKELKKNKKQRQMVRQAVLKGKDPAQILEEMDKIDEMEFNIHGPSPLNEKVLKEKRKKLKETFDRVMKLYHTEDPELWSELKRKEVEYEKKRNKRISYFESVRAAQSIQIDEIPLPSSKETPTPMALPRIQLPPPALIIPPVPQAMLSQLPPQHNEEETPQVNEEELLKLPGCPPFAPPNLMEMSDLDSDYDEDLLPKNRSKRKRKEETDEVASIKPPNEVQQKMLALSGQNIDDFMKEMENVQRKKEAERAAGKQSESSSEDSKEEGDEDEEDDDDDDDENEDVPEEPKQHDEGPILPPPQVEHTILIPPPMRPVMPPPFPVPFPPMLRGMGPGMPPGMPRMPRLGPRMGLRPPGPPPGLPPKYAKGPQMQVGGSHGMPPKDPKSATITAKPQIRNLSADVTRFVPTTLRMKKDEPKKPKPKPAAISQPIQPAQGPTKNDAYMQFMKEMEGLFHKTD